MADQIKVYYHAAKGDTICNAYFMIGLQPHHQNLVHRCEREATHDSAHMSALINGYQLLWND